MKKMVAIDYGQAKLGLAVTDALRLYAHPRPAVLHAKTLELTAELLVKTLEKEGPIERVILGWPLKMSGVESHLCTPIRQLAALLEQHLHVPVEFLDERLTSKQSDRQLREQGLKRKARSQLEDSQAACILLQTYLEKKSSIS